MDNHSRAANPDNAPDVSIGSLFPYPGESAEEAAESVSEGAAHRYTIGEVV